MWSVTKQCRIEAIENKIGAGLIEEVVTVAENELELVGDMIKDQPYDLPVFSSDSLLTCWQMATIRRASTARAVVLLRAW